MKIITLAILVLLLAGMTDARMPIKGDQITAMVGSGSTMSGSTAFHYSGIVEDIGNGLICMNCTYLASSGSDNPNDDISPYHVCLGIGNIIQIRWW